MRKQDILLFFAPLVLMTIISSCNRFRELEAPFQTEYIRFTTADGIAASGTVETKAMENEITCDITDWEADIEDGSEVKSSLTNNLSGSAGVFGYNFTAWGSSVKPTVMYNLKNTIEDGNLTPERKILWKTYSEGSLRFYAYAPYGKFSLSSESTGGVPYLTYTVPTANKDQIDILYAQSEDVSFENRDPVPLAFKHAMAAVQFRLGIEGATLNSVTISGVNKTGKLSLDGTWSAQSGSQSYSVAHTDSLLIMIPQTVPDGATITLNYNDGTSDNNISASIAGQLWEKGKKIVYTLSKKDDPIQYIYFDLALGNVILTNETYSGYINVQDESKSTVHRYSVTGTHSDNNRYYIYCSVHEHDSDNNCKDVWAKVTGYKSEVDYNKAMAGELVIPDIPPYASDIMEFTTTKKGITCPDWGKFITNNPDPYTVRDTWDNGDQNYSTTNTISICGSAIFDVTLDRVFSRHYYKVYKNKQNKDSLDVTGSLAIGYNGRAYVDNFTEKVTLRLKNNNALSRIHYKKPIDSTEDGYLRITSADGDGIAKGTLTVTANKIIETGVDKRLVFSLIGPRNEGTEDDDYGDERGKRHRQIKDLFFDGGIVYVGTQKYNSSKWTNNTALLGVIGGVNTQSEITINGGILTAVSNNTSPAIGGGGGWESQGGKGVVTINGGTVYAYSHGVLGTFDNQLTVLIPPAIGGGGTLGEYVDEKQGGIFVPADAGSCDVTINGGNVYAYAVGGPAIGGGSCGRHAGGKCTFTMRGGNVVAKSLAGNIGGMDVSATNAIGGGRSGLVDGDGGTATLILKGGNLQTGSVGGGKVDARNLSGKIGSADITIDGGNTNAQFIMAKGAGTAPMFKMYSGTISNSNSASGEFANIEPNGGAVYIEEGTCSIEGGTISKCSADLGGAVYLKGGTFNMSGGQISDCKSSKDGGAIYVEAGNANVSGGKIYHNIASKGNGGGVYVSGGNFSMPAGGKGQILNNAADSNPDQVGGTYYGGNGGGIYVSSSTTDPVVDIFGGEIMYNAADRNGGGLCVDMSDSSHVATITIGNEEVAKRDTLSPNIRLNSAALSGGGMSVQGNGSNIIIYSGTVKGNVSAFVKNEDIRNDRGTVDLLGKNETGKTPQVNVQYNTIKFYANNGVDPEPYDEQRVVTSTNSPLRPTAKALAFEKEFYYIASWNTKRDGTGTSYKVDGSGAVMNLTDDIPLYAQWVMKKVSK